MSNHHLYPPPDSVHLTVHSLPRDVADEIRDAQSQNPELLTRILLYGMVHKEIFNTLGESWGR